MGGGGGGDAGTGTLYGELGSKRGEEIILHGRSGAGHGRDTREVTYRAPSIKSANLLQNKGARFLII